MSDDILKVAAVQASAVWLDRKRTAEKAVAFIEQAGREDVKVAVFPETFLPGYPFWLCRTDGAAFEEPKQKRAYAQYLNEAVEIDSPEIRAIVDAARSSGVFCFLGVAERGQRGGRGTIYCSLVAIDPKEGIVGVHRKLVPTYDERLVWGHGDGHGLKAHSVGNARIGGLNCWENWMPLARYALYSDGIDIHAGAWPGIAAMHADLMRHIAKEGRVWCIAASGLLHVKDIPEHFVYHDSLGDDDEACIFDGGSAILSPDGAYVAGPTTGEECLLTADVDLAKVREERQNFDPTGHYSRPDIFQLSLDDRRQTTVTRGGAT